MRMHLLLAASIPAMLIAAPAMAQESGLSGNLDLSFRNNIDTSVVTDVTYTKDVALRGTVTLGGTVDVDSSAVAVNDVKQLQGVASVSYREENELNGENGYVSPVFGPGYSEGGNDPNDSATNGTPEAQIRAGFFAPIINTVTGLTVNGTGNIGVNTAAGYYNMQLNSAALAVSDNEETDAGGGWSEASTTSLQALVGTSHAATPGELLSEDDPENGGGSNNFRDRNTVSAINVSGAGNIGVNVATGAFNQQSNLLTLAVSNNSSLAEANTGLVQLAAFNEAEQQDSQNIVSGVAVGGTGNIGLNAAAGVGNQQLNSLTIATSVDRTPATTLPGGGTGNDPS
jgi:hypothetical protein